MVGLRHSRDTTEEERPCLLAPLLTTTTSYLNQPTSSQSIEQSIAKFTMPPTTHKRKGSDFSAPIVATVVGAGHASTTTTTTSKMQQRNAIAPSPDSLKQEWHNIQQQMQAYRAKWQISQEGSSNEEDSDPILYRIEQLIQRPRILQEQIDNLPNQAANIKQEQDEEWTKLQNKWQRKSDRKFQHEQRTTELYGQIDALRGEAHSLDEDVRAARDKVEKQKAVMAQQAEEKREQECKTEQQMTRMNQKISMYACTTGIRFDEEETEAWAGYVVRRIVCFCGAVCVCVRRVF